MNAAHLPAPALPAFIERQLPSNLHRYAVVVDGWRFHVMEGGAPDARPVVMLHGNPTWGFLWRLVAARLATRPLRLIIPDLIGLGYSYKPGAPHLHTLENHGRWVHGLMEALQLQNVILAAQDWGGPIGMMAMVHQPSRLTALMLGNTIVGPPRAGFRPTTFHRFAQMPLVSDVAFRLLDFPQRGLHLAQGDKKSIQGDVARAYTEPLKHLTDNVAPLALARMVPDSLEHPSIDALKKTQRLAEEFRGPAAIVWGDKDPVLGRALSRLQRMIPNASVTHTTAGHFLQEQVPDALADAICRVAGLST